MQQMHFVSCVHISVPHLECLLMQLAYWPIDVFLFRVYVPHLECLLMQVKAATNDQELNTVVDTDLAYGVLQRAGIIKVKQCLCALRGPPLGFGIF